jgi:transglutaminase-like putative cysteine protease
MYYAIRHFTRYRYSRPISQSSMEVRMHPRSEYSQRCFTFQLSISPRVRVFSYHDHTGNIIHHFDIPEQHKQLTITADALVDVDAFDGLPEALSLDSWNEIDSMIAQDDYWDMLMPSHFARPSPELEQLGHKLGVKNRNGSDPLTVLRTLNTSLFQELAYSPDSTSVDSPIEDALRTRQGVCQDFAHIMLALVRNMRIPCRYVSGYLHHDASHPDRSKDGATHAWVEALLPRWGWVGFDPTNNLLAGGRHIRTAIGRDYADVPPTTGIMKGSAKSEMQVRVRVTPSEAVLPPDQEFASDEEWSKFLETDQKSEKKMQQAQQQQAQQ